MNDNQSLGEDLRRILLTGIITIVVMAILLQVEKKQSFLSDALTVTPEIPVQDVELQNVGLDTQNLPAELMDHIE